MPKQRLGKAEQDHLSVWVKKGTLQKVKRKALDENMTLAFCVDYLLSDALYQQRREKQNEQRIAKE